MSTTNIWSTLVYNPEYLKENFNFVLGIDIPVKWDLGLHWTQTYVPIICFRSFSFSLLKDFPHPWWGLVLILHGHIQDVQMSFLFSHFRWVVNCKQFSRNLKESYLYVLDLEWKCLIFASVMENKCESDWIIELWKVMKSITLVFCVIEEKYLVC